MDTALLVIILVGLVGTLLLGYAALKYRDTSGSYKRARRARTEPGAPPRPTPASRRSTESSGGCLGFVGLIVLVVLGVVVYYSWIAPERARLTAPVASVPSDEISTIVARPGQPAEVVTRKGWQLQLYEGDRKKFSHRMMRRGEDRVWVFITKPGVESAEIKVRVYYAPRR